MSNIRNKPCSCGSGKKHKKCCGSAEGFNRIQAEKAAKLEEWKRERSQRIKSHAAHPTMSSFAAIIAATLSMKRP